MVRLQVLGVDGIKQVHEATLRILAETGIALAHPGARDLLTSHGARVAGDRVLIPADLVTSCLAQCPRTVRMQGRDPARVVVLGDGACHAHNVGGVPNILDGSDGRHATDPRRRAAVRQDNAKTARLLDALPNVSSVTPFFTPQDVPAASMALWMYYDTIANTTKPVHGPGVQTSQEVRAVAEMARIACPDGALSVAISPVSPLFLPNDVAGAILEVARLGLPFGPLPCPIMGATAPMSMAGALAQQNAEVLASIVLAQLTHPGLPIFYCGRLSVMHPRTGLSVWGNPDIGLISAATVEIAHHYGLPVNVYGLCTDAHTSDVQSGYERAINALVPALAGADEISGVGEVWGGVVGSLAQMVMDDEILDSVKRMLRGFEVDQETLAVEVIAQVMDGPRNFLGQKHTAKYMRRGEVMQARLAGREGWAEWEASGRRGLVERASERAAELLASHEVPPLSKEQQAAIEDVIQTVEREQEEAMKRRG
jgi:trimethylamine---corrinoid protein Co-methyltransferase